MAVSHLICDFVEIRQVILRPAGGLPLLLIALGAAGMLWAEVSWAERFAGVTVQNIIGSTFNSHLFDFTHGWAYVVGVGVAGGVVLKQTIAADRRPYDAA